MKLSDLSRAKRQEYLSDRFVHHEHPGSVEQRKKRVLRKRVTRTHYARLFARKRTMERFGLDVNGSGPEAGSVRRIMRNARKRERAAR